MSNDMASARTFSQKKLTSPAPSGSALESRLKGRGEAISSVAALQNEDVSQNEMAFASLGTRY